MSRLESKFSSKSGVTLIEMLMVLVIIGIIAAIIGYNVRQGVQKSRLQETTMQVINDLRQARSKAQLTSQNAVVMLCPTGTIGCAVNSPSKVYSTSWASSSGSNTGVERTLPYNITIAPAPGASYPSQISYSAPNAETTGSGTVWQVTSPSASIPPLFIKVVGVTGRVILSDSVN